MGTLCIFAATLLLFLAVSSATVYQTTIRDDGSAFNQGGQSQRCQQQIQSQQFQQCKQYIRQQAEQQGGRQDEVLMMRGVGNQQHQQEQQTLRRCCQALQNMDQQCQCEGLRQIGQREQGQQEHGQQGRGQGQQQQQQQEIVQIAQRLPERCGTGQACRRMQVGWF